MLLSQFYKLTEEEVLCIRYHMGAFTDKSEWNDYTWLCKEELKKIGVDVEAWNRERGSIHDIREQ